MSIKSNLRKEIKIERENIPNKDIISHSIYDKFINSSLYINSQILLCYASLKNEISTDEIICRAIKDKKTVALPYCIDDDGTMDFFIINSLNDLSAGSFGVREPNLSICKKLISFDDAVILVPGLCFDKNGFRLGYGKGYYDRFLEKHPLISVGLCYNTLVKNEIPRSKYDLPVDYLITEDNFLSINGGENG